MSEDETVTTSQATTYTCNSHGKNSPWTCDDPPAAAAARTADDERRIRIGEAGTVRGRLVHVYRTKVYNFEYFRNKLEIVR